MTRVAKTLFTLALILTVAACESRTGKTDGGGVILSISDFDGLPILVIVNGSNFVQIDSLTVSNTPKDPNGTTSSLMNVEIESYEITFTRADAGTRIPVSFVRGIFGQSQQTVRIRKASHSPLQLQSGDELDGERRGLALNLVARQGAAEETQPQVESDPG